MTAATTLAPPAGEPISRRKYQLTDLTGNHNKWWMIEIWPLDGGRVHARTTWGRVGSAAQSSDKVCTEWAAERLQAEKREKGYREVDLHLPAVVRADPATPVAPALEPKVAQLLAWIFREAGERIAGYLACNVDALSQAQLTAGRQLLDLAQREYAGWEQAPSSAAFEGLVATVQAFYNAVPTQLSHRIDPQEAVLQFCRQFDEQEDRLNQLEAALATYVRVAQGEDPLGAQYGLLGATIEHLPDSDPDAEAIHERIRRTAVHGYRLRVRDIFRVCVPQERAAFEANRRGRSRVELLYHGTRNANVRHILRSGLICPRTASHGRMFGHGIYFANVASKSAGYCLAGTGAPNMLFLADVALGRVFTAPCATPGLSAPPWFHDSVMGRGGTTLGLINDEYIVYKPEQQTLRYLVTWDRA
jgi:poly [ADP-ribose] polymerase 2/3/4